MTATTEPAFAPLAPGVGGRESAAMSHREVLEALSGLLLAMFVAILSSTVVSTALGALLAHHASADITSGLAGQGIKATGSADQVPDVSTLPAPVAQIIEHAYGPGVGEIFLTAAPLGLVSLVAVALLREVPLGGKSGIDIARERASTHNHQGATP
jgi:hypothetical protein